MKIADVASHLCHIYLGCQQRRPVILKGTSSFPSIAIEFLENHAWPEKEISGFRSVVVVYGVDASPAFQGLCNCVSGVRSCYT